MASSTGRVDAQDEVIAFLRRPDSYGLAEGTVETVETHISIVFLAGECAYKLKRAVNTPNWIFRRRSCGGGPGGASSRPTAVPRRNYIWGAGGLAARPRARGGGAGEADRS